MKSGNLNFLEPSGPLQACNGTAYLLLPYRIATTEANIWHGIPGDNHRTIRIDVTLVKNGDLDVPDTSSSSVKSHYKPFISSSSYPTGKSLPIIILYRCTVHFEIYVVHSPKMHYLLTWLQVLNLY